MNITILSASEVEYLAHMFSVAAERQTKVRMCQEGGIKIAVGGGMWTHPMGRPADIDGHTPVR